MAKYGSANTVISFDDSAGSLVDISAYVLSVGAVKKSAMLVDATTIGMAWKAVLNSTLYEMDPMPVETFYDDAASTGPWVLFNDIGNVAGPADGREFKVLYGAAKSTLWKVIIESVERNLAIGELHKLTAVLRHAYGAAPTEA